MILQETPPAALAVFAHPDDADVACGGTLARWTQSGASVHLVIATQGDKGSADPGADPAALAAERAGEVAAASAALGLAGHHLLAIPDGDVDNTAELRGRLVELIRRVRPHTVIGPDPTAVYFGASYVNHRDHRELGWAVLDAVAPAAASPLYFPEAGPAHQVEQMLLSGTLDPDCWVDVEPVLDVKVAAVLCHRSQVGDAEWLAAFLEERAAEAGREGGLRRAEGFRRLRFGPP